MSNNKRDRFPSRKGGENLPSGKILKLILTAIVLVVLVMRVQSGKTPVPVIPDQSTESSGAAVPVNTAGAVLQILPEQTAEAPEETAGASQETAGAPAETGKASAEASGETEETHTEVTADPGTTKDAETEQTASEVPDLRFRNKNLLNDHYKKHGIEMGFSSAKEYQAAAAAVTVHPDVLHKKEAEDGDDVYFIEETGEFVVVSGDGYIRTYFCPDSGIKYYNRQ